MLMMIIQNIVKNVLKENSVLKKIGLNDVNGLINNEDKHESYCHNCKVKFSIGNTGIAAISFLNYIC